MYFGSSFMNMASPVMDEELMAAIQGGNMAYAQHLLAKKRKVAMPRNQGGYPGGTMYTPETSPGNAMDGGTMYAGGSKNFDEFATPAPDAVASGAEMNPIAAARNKGQRGMAMRAMHSAQFENGATMPYAAKGLNRGMMR